MTGEKGGLCRNSLIKIEISHYLLLIQPRRKLFRWLCSRLSCVVSCPLRIAGMTSIPVMVHRAAHNDLKPSMGPVIRFTARWPCSTRLLRSFDCRRMRAVFRVRL
jgi:hypothetical protein